MKRRIRKKKKMLKIRTGRRKEGRKRRKKERGG